MFDLIMSPSKDAVQASSLSQKQPLFKTNMARFKISATAVNFFTNPSAGTVGNLTTK